MYYERKSTRFSKRKNTEAELAVSVFKQISVAWSRDKIPNEASEMHKLFQM